VVSIRRRGFLTLLCGSTMAISPSAAQPASAGPALASYYSRHMALIAGVAYTWSGDGQPVRQRDGVRQVGVARDSCFALQSDGQLLRWANHPERAETLMPGVAAMASGESGWFAIDATRQLWHGGTKPQPVATDVVTACIGDGADYYIRQDGTLWVKGLAHRGQYGDGRLTASSEFVNTARDAIAVVAHTGHAIYLRRDGVVLGTGGNRFGPLSSHGLGDKADRWGPLFEGARSIATGSRHSAAIRVDGSLWVWGDRFGIAPRKLLDGVVAVAAGDTATIALDAQTRLWQWAGDVGPRRLSLR
jgi:hypothetical protein